MNTSQNQKIPSVRAQNHSIQGLVSVSYKWGGVKIRRGVGAKWRRCRRNGKIRNKKFPRGFLKADT